MDFELELYSLDGLSMGLILTNGVAIGSGTSGSVG